MYADSDSSAETTEGYDQLAERTACRDNVATAGSPGLLASRPGRSICQPSSWRMVKRLPLSVYWGYGVGIQTAQEIRSLPPILALGLTCDSTRCYKRVQE